MRRINKASVEFISLVPKGANKMPVLYKADGTVEFDTLSKASEDAGELLNVVYTPEHRDSQGDIADARVIKEMAYDAAQRGLAIDVRHNGKALPREAAYLAESFLVAKGDSRFQDWKDTDGQAVDLTGAWATVIKINDPELRRLYREGEWGGVSMAGQAEVVTQKEDDAPGWFTKALHALGLKATREEAVDMEKQELLDVLKASNAALLKELKPKPVEKEAPPEVDLNDPKAVEAHLAKLRQEELAKSVDLTDPKAVEAHLEKLRAEGEDAESKSDDDEPDEVADLRRRLKKAEQRSNQPSGKERETAYVGFSKEDARLMELGDAMAGFLNGKEES